ncbi:MAG: hypothetical protein PHX18_08780 [Candidatus Gastranaerophilales bacterium]|nr:hypothetical protein [Candidatus Gastranaerophilales bacterium]
MPALKYVHHEFDIKHEVKKTSERINDAASKANDIAHKKATRLNMVLLSGISISAVAFLCVYSLVSLSENRLANLYTHISELNYENIELENKLENIKSFYSVENKVAANTTFDKAKKVIEVEMRDVKEKERVTFKNSSFNSAIGF